MNLINRLMPKNEKLQMMHDDPNLLERMTKRILSWTPVTSRDYVIICIGTDRSTGDAFGPFAGSYLAEKNRNTSISTVHCMIQYMPPIWRTIFVISAWNTAIHL